MFLSLHYEFLTPCHSFSLAPSLCLSCRDMAHLVNKQGEMVEKVAEDTEQSRERAEAGLAQVQQAAKYQPTCIVM